MIRMTSEAGALTPAVATTSTPATATAPVACHRTAPLAPVVDLTARRAEQRALDWLDSSDACCCWAATFPRSCRRRARRAS